MSAPILRRAEGPAISGRNGEGLSEWLWGLGERNEERGTRNEVKTHFGGIVDRVSWSLVPGPSFLP
jgi:hypothetical protein